MNCREAQRDFHPYLDGEFDTEESMRLEAHLHQCEACMAAFVFERNVWTNFREKLTVDTAPRELHLRIRQSLESGSAPDWVRWLPWSQGSGARGRMQFAGAFSIAFAAVVGWGLAGSNPTAPDELESRPVTASVSLPTLGMTPDEQDNAPNPVLSMVTGDLTRSALGAHLGTDESTETRESSFHLQKMPTFHLEPPIREALGVRLIHTRYGGGGLVPSIVHEYDMNGSRLTAIQSMIPRGWAGQGRFYNVERKDGFTVMTFQQSENVLTSLVSTLEPAALLDLTRNQMNR